MPERSRFEISNPSEVVNDSLLRLLRSRNRGDQCAAATVLEALGPDGLEVLLTVIAREEGKRRQKRRFAVLICVALFVLSQFIEKLSAHFIHFEEASSIINVVFWSSVIGFFAVSRKHQDAIHALARFDDVRAAGPFTVGLACKEQWLRQVVEAKLIELLPQMRASDAKYLDTVQRAELNKQLGRKKANTELVKAILLAWQQVGDEQSIPYVERISADAKRAPDIRQAAADCLPYLRQSAANLKGAQTLLRASDGGMAHPEELLRATSPELEVNAEELLRAAPAENASPVVTSYMANHAQEQRESRAL